jgi:hypothetical protein
VTLNILHTAGTCQSGLNSGQHWLCNLISRVKFQECKLLQGIQVVRTKLKRIRCASFYSLALIVD